VIWRVSVLNLGRDAWNGWVIWCRHRTPRICLFAWLPQTHPFHGPKKRWRDILKADLTSLGQVRLIAYYVLFAGELLDGSVIRPAISVSQRDNCQ